MPAAVLNTAMYIPDEYILHTLFLKNTTGEAGSDEGSGGWGSQFYKWKLELWNFIILNILFPLSKPVNFWKNTEFMGVNI